MWPLCFHCCVRLLHAERSRPCFRRVCCAGDGACPSVNGVVAPPEPCTPACAVATHSLFTTCGATIDTILGHDEFDRNIREFESGCLSSADPLVFLDAIMVCCVLHPIYRSCQHWLTIVDLLVSTYCRAQTARTRMVWCCPAFQVMVAATFKRHI